MPEERRGPGRPPAEITPARMKRLLKAIRDGNYYDTACKVACISYSVFRRWMNKGRLAKRGQYRAFWLAVKEAEAKAEDKIVRDWRAQIPENWQAARDFLARRKPKKWGPKEKVEHRHGGSDEADAKPIQVVVYMPDNGRDPEINAGQPPAETDGQN